MKYASVGFLILFFLLGACQPTQESDSESSAALAVDFEKYTLDNGLEVVFHLDRSDPVVAVALTAHVGSAREKYGRTGFAHLFEHLLFLESENLGKGGLDQMSARIGGSGANGSTSKDRTNYFQTVPNDALEKMIWAEADKLGWFINTVTEPVLAKEKQVVKNEKRQSYDNRPYGNTGYVIDGQMYPQDHPYHWRVIGSLEDLQNATLDDVKEFFRRWYVPNNVTLTIAGDFDVEQAKEWVEKYFAEIPRGEDIMPLPKRAAELSETKSLYHEDNFARLPELTLAWPTVPLYHEDSYALSVLAQYLSQGKQAPLNQVLVDEDQVAPRVRMYNQSQELAGMIQLTVRAFASTDLDIVRVSVDEAFAKFEQEGISQQDLDRILAGQETRFYQGLSSVLGKGFQLAQYNIFAGDPGFLEKDIANTLSVSTEDVMRVYETYIKGKAHIATSFVPKGQLDLALEGAVLAEVEEEQIVQGAEESFDASIVAEYERTPSTFDRTTEPAYGSEPQVRVPDVWEASLANGLEVYGIQNDEVPLVEFNLILEGGALLDAEGKVGVANLMAQLMNRGTANRTPEELEAAIQQLGARISISASKEQIQVVGSTLKRNYAATLALATEMVLEPRWDAEEFELIKQGAESQLEQQEADPNRLATLHFDQLVYGADHLMARNLLGDLATLSGITVEDLQAYYQSNLSPSISRFLIVGDVSKAEVVESLKTLETDWEKKEISLPVLPEVAAPSQSQVYFYDVPNAKQSVLRIGSGALAAVDEDYYPAQVMNYILGGGGFASKLTQQLREGKGYTYGIRSRYAGNESVGNFSISSGVRANVTLESTQEIKAILENYAETFSEQDLATTQGFLTKSQARAFETSQAKLSLLNNMSAYGWSADYALQQGQIVRDMTIPRIQELAGQYANPDQMIWLVVGDAETQLHRMAELGYGEPILINVDSESAQ